MSAKTVVTLVMLIALAGGCVEYDERIELNTDGSGLVRMHLAISEQVLTSMTTPTVGKESELLPVPREELVEDLEKEGFEVKDLRAESSRGLRHVYLVIGFKNVAALAGSKFFGGRKVSLERDGAKWQFRQEISVSEDSLSQRAGNRLRRTPTLRRKDKPEEKPQENRTIIQQLEERFGKTQVREMFKKYSLVFSVQLNGAGLIHTNGRNHRDATAVWKIPLDVLIDRKPTLRMEGDFAVVEPAATVKEEKP